MTHLAAQRALVRMLFDAGFARAVREQPDEVLGHVAPPLRRQLAAVDERALRQDRLRLRRTLRALAEEWRGSTTLALAESRSLAALERFFSSTAFHRAVEERGVLSLAFGEFLAEQVAEGALRGPHLADVLALEAALARARRAAPNEDENGKRQTENERDRLARARGVFPVEIAAGALAALQQAERYLFEVGLMPAVALCDDAPRLVLDAATHDRRRLHLCTVPVTDGDGVRLVTIDAELHALLVSLPAPRRPADLLADARARGLDDARARARLAELIDDEIVVRA
jgi:hypothetical protein